MTRVYASTEVRLQCHSVYLGPSTLDLFFVTAVVLFWFLWFFETGFVLELTL